MSGEIVLLDSPDGRVARLIQTAGLVAAHAGVPVAIIGGIAVLCRVPDGLQRATQDVDLVSEDSAEIVAESGAAADNLVAANLATRDTGSASTRLLVGETKVEIIETMAVTPIEAADVEPERSRLFILAHRWALESAAKLHDRRRRQRGPRNGSDGIRSGTRGDEAAFHPGPLR